jgi:broad specificity phosphatase PhoE
MDKQLTTFYIVRHGQTDWNVNKRVQGHTDIPLNETGELQAKELGEKFRNIQFDLAFSSDLMRAKRTAEIILLERKLEVATTELLRERNFGNFEGKPGDALTAFRDLLEKLTEEEKVSHPDNNIESDENVATRLVTFLRETAITHLGKTILATSHGGVLRVLLVRLGYGTEETLPYGCIENMAWIKLETDGVDFYVKETEGVNKRS